MPRAAAVERYENVEKDPIVGHLRQARSEGVLEIPMITPSADCSRATVWPHGSLREPCSHSARRRRRHPSQYAVSVEMDPSLGDALLARQSRRSHI